VSVVSAPPASGKTVLRRSWISWAGVAGSAAWVPAGRGERDPQQFWLSVLAAPRQTAAGSALVRELTAAPDLDGWVITERLLADLAPLDDRLWLVVDDVQELGADALRQLELLIMRAPPGLRFVLADRYVYLAYFNAGLQIYDITDPHDPHITGYYIPDDPTQRRGPIPAKLVHQAEDVLVDRRGVIYMSEGNRGIYILTHNPSQ